jgi:hypothetical protein
MAVDLSLLKMHIDAFNKAKNSINEKKALIVGTDVEAAFDTLKDHWRTGGFEPKEMVELVSIIKKNLNKFGSNRELQAELKNFASMCEIYYTKDDDTFEAFQATLQNKKPLDSSIIQRIYENRIGNLPETAVFDEIHKKTNGNSLYELFCFEPDTYQLRILKALVEDKNEFSKSLLKLKGKWEDFYLFATVLSNEQSKEKYDAYYRFLRCKKILKAIHRRNKNVEYESYINTVGELVKYSCKNSGQAEHLIVDFCAAIGLTCKPITSEQFENYKKWLESNRKQIENVLNQLNVKQKELDDSLSSIANNIDDFLYSVRTSINSKAKQIKEKKSNTNHLYKEEGMIRIMDDILSEFNKLYLELEKIRSSCSDAKTFIAKEVTDAVNKDRSITADNIVEVFNYVSFKEAVIIERYNKFIKIYNNVVIKNVQSHYNKLESEFANTIANMTQNREQIAVKLKWEFLTGNKHHTIKFFLIMPLEYFSLFLCKLDNFNMNLFITLFILINSIIFVCYVNLAIKDFNKNNNLAKFLNENMNESYKYRNKAVVIGKIILSFIFCLLTSVSVIVAVIGIQEKL